jgi:predicted alpha/beta superfamily hydrolase
MPLSIACLLLMLAADDGPRGGEVTVTFVARVPASTPRNAKVYLAGNLVAAGRWKADGVPMTRRDDGRYSATIHLNRGDSLEYKLTLGAWAGVEKDASGRDRTNRALVVNREETIEIEVAAWGSGEANKPIKSTATGDLHVHREFASKVLGNRRKVVVWLPPGYDSEPSRRYPVLYLQDGQNVFDAATSAFGNEWRADETADRLIRDKAIPPIILVAIDNTPNRMNEYTPIRDESMKTGGDGPRYVRFLVEELKPFIDATYRTQPGPKSTAIGGSSLGGLIAMEMALDHPEVFGLCAAVSPSIWWAGDRLIADVKAKAPAARRVKFRIDMGTREGVKQGDAIHSHADRARKLAKALEDSGLKPDRDFHLEIIEGGEHTEKDWAARFDRILIDLFREP